MIKNKDINIIDNKGNNAISKRYKLDLKSLLLLDSQAVNQYKEEVIDDQDEVLRSKQ